MSKFLHRVWSLLEIKLENPLFNSMLWLILTAIVSSTRLPLGTYARCRSAGTPIFLHF